ncbi:MAG: protein kinase, partial [Planctomycetaceae bacterium]
GGTLQAVVRELRECGDGSPRGDVLLRAVDRALDDRGESRPGESRLRKRIEEARWDETVCWIGSRLALALDYSHKLGVLHRDIKPANVLLTAEGMPQLADFNISFSSKLDGVSPAAYFGGSLAYMSPEQLEAYSPAYERPPDTLDGRGDLYSLGVLLWELLTGRRPFRDTKSEGGPVQLIEEMIDRRRNGPAESTPPSWCASRILDVLRKCLSPDPDDRWQTGAELAAQLELCRHPRAHDLLVPPKESWRRRLFPWSGLIVMLILTVPNVAAGVFNLAYNDAEMHRNLAPLSYNIFKQSVLVINSVLYPFGLGWAFLRSHRIQRSVDDPDADAAAMRARTLGLGHFAAMMAVLLWALGGLVYPISIHVASGSLPAITYAQFFSSLVMCGLIAAAYPFFFVSLFSLRVMYPGLLRDGPGVSRDILLLRQLQARAKRYLLIGGLAPMLGVLVVLAPWSQETGMQKTALLVFAGVGAIGSFVLYRVNNALQSDIETIVDATTNVRQSRDPVSR